MANGHGGARPGAGRPRKPLNEKLIEGNPGKRPVERIAPKAPSESRKKTAPKYIAFDGKEGGADIPSATEIYAVMVDFLKRVKVEELVPPNLIDDFAFLRRSYLECEYMNREHGRIANGKRSPYVTMALDYQKSMMQVFNQIWIIVERNSAEQYERKNDFLLLLQNRGF
jgi:hypothetical protein